MMISVESCGDAVSCGSPTRSRNDFASMTDPMVICCSWDPVD